MSEQVQFSDNAKQAMEALERYQDAGGRFVDDKLSALMDLQAADGVNGNRPIDWDKLLSADQFTLVHDVSGIQRHINRETGALGDCFIPRCAA